MLHHRVHTSPQLFPIFSQLNRTHNLPLHSFNIHFNGFFILIRPMQDQLFQAGLLAPGFPNKILHAFISSPPMRATTCSNVYGTQSFHLFIMSILFLSCTNKKNVNNEMERMQKDKFFPVSGNILEFSWCV
jgi:hypothetical protein